MKALLYIISIFCICPFMSAAQTFGRDSVSTVIVHIDPRFNDLSARQAEINKQSQMGVVRIGAGFRIQVANTQNRNEANAVKAELLRRFPEHKSYLLYQSPNFRVRIGNFLTQKEAFQLRKMISALYPDKGIYIVPDNIEYTPVPEEGETVEK